MAGRRIVYGLSLAGAAAFWIFYDGMVSVYLFAATLALPFFSLLLSLPFLRGRAAEIGSPRTVPRGGECTLLFRIRVKDRPSVLPGRLRVVFRDLMEDHEDRMTFDAPADGSIVFQAVHSGVWQAEIRQASLCDFLGIWRFAVPTPPPVRLTVPPVPAEPHPAPDFGFFRVSATRSRPGGGFSEIHELRDYRPGDPMRSVHWKATAKTDVPVVREPQESLARRALLTFSMPSRADRDEADRVLDRLVWVSGALLERDIPHAAACLSDGSLFSVEVRDDLFALTERLMSSPLSAAVSPGSASLPVSDWVYRIAEGREGEEKEAWS